MEGIPDALWPDWALKEREARELEEHERKEGEEAPALLSETENINIAEEMSENIKIAEEIQRNERMVQYRLSIAPEIFKKAKEASAKTYEELKNDTEIVEKYYSWESFYKQSEILIKQLAVLANLYKAAEATHTKPLDDYRFERDGRTVKLNRIDVAVQQEYLKKELPLLGEHLMKLQKYMPNLEQYKIDMNLEREEKEEERQRQILAQRMEAEELQQSERKQRSFFTFARRR